MSTRGFVTCQQVSREGMWKHMRWRSGLMSGLKIGVIGATGMVGRQYLEILEQSPLEISELQLYASARSVGSRMTFAGESLPVEEFTVEAVRGLDIALFSISTELARQY